MLIIYHSRGLLPARQAAVRHMGWEPGEWGLQRLRVEGLWHLGEDEWGRRVYALGRSSRPDVVYRAVAGVSALFELPRREIVVRSVGPPVAWTDIGASLLRIAGLGAMADRVEAAALAWGWRLAEDAVQRTRGYLAEIGGRT